MRFQGLMAAVAGVVCAAGVARAQDPCAQEASRGRPPVVDFSGPPGALAGFDKVRVTVTPERDPEGGLTLRLAGQAYYPDGAILQVTARHVALERPFLSLQARVAERRFEATLGPIARALPGGALAVEVWFRAGGQPRAVRAALLQERYFRCSPPCAFDRLSVVTAEHDLGGARAFAASATEEKERIREFLDGVLAARDLAHETLARLAQGQAAPEAARDAVVALRDDVTAARARLREYADTRALLLFPDQVRRAHALGSDVVAEAERLLKGAPSAAERARGEAKLEGAVDGLYGFFLRTETVWRHKRGGGGAGRAASSADAAAASSADAAASSGGQEEASATGEQGASTAGGPTGGPAPAGGSASSAGRPAGGPGGSGSSGADPANLDSEGEATKSHGEIL